MAEKNTVGDVKNICYRLEKVLVFPDVVGLIVED